MRLHIAGVGRIVAAGATPGRKVRAPQGRTLDNIQEGQPSDSATESKPPGFGRVRVKRWCKRPPDAVVTRHARHTPFGARPNREGGRPGHSLPGRLLEGAGNRTPRGMTITHGQPCGQNPAYSPTPAYCQPEASHVRHFRAPSRATRPAVGHTSGRRARQPSCCRHRRACQAVSALARHAALLACRPSHEPQRRGGRHCFCFPPR